MARHSLLADSQWPPSAPTCALAVLCSGGLDSAILLGEALRAYPSVQPLYVRVGSFWEPTELDYLRRYLAALSAPNLRSLVILDQPIHDVYGPHWSLTGQEVPGSNTPDEAVFLPGRNVLLLAKPLLWCHLNGFAELATAPLASNPFPDATPDFYTEFAALVSRAVGGSLRVLRPYADLGLHKMDVLQRGRDLPLELTFSCIQPVRGMHCGSCNKCAERKAGFVAAKMNDPTQYAE